MKRDRKGLNGQRTKRPYRKSRRFDSSCRCHGGCGYCLENRMHKFKKKGAMLEELN